MNPWFDEQSVGLIGGILGSSIGVFFGAIGGGVGGPLAALGKAKPLVLGIFYLGIIVGLGLLGTGVYALIDGQPNYVWAVFALPGAGLAVLMGGLLPVIHMRYRQADQRQLDAQEFAN